MAAPSAGLSRPTSCEDNLEYRVRSRRDALVLVGAAGPPGARAGGLCRGSRAPGRGMGEPRALVVGCVGRTFAFRPNREHGLHPPYSCFSQNTGLSPILARRARESALFLSRRSTLAPRRHRTRPCTKRPNRQAARGLRPYTCRVRSRRDALVLVGATCPPARGPGGFAEAREPRAEAREPRALRAMRG